MEYIFIILGVVREIFPSQRSVDRELAVKFIQIGACRI